MSAAKKTSTKLVEDDTASTEELVDEVMAVLYAMDEDDRCEVFAAIAETFDLETGEELDEDDDDGGDESGPDEDDEDDEDEDEDDEDEVDEDVE